MNHIEEALQYFQAESAYDKLFRLFRKKYESLGSVGGSVRLSSFTNEELTTLSLFMGVNEEDLRKKGSLTLLQFERQLGNTRFEGLRLIELLEVYFGEALISKREAKETKQQEEERIISFLQVSHPSLSFWFEFLRTKSPSAYWVYSFMKEEPEKFQYYVRLLDHAMQQLPNGYERLPFFSHRVAKNPHSFDIGTNLGKMFLQVLSVHRGDSSIVSSTEDITELLQHYGILRDDLLNFATCVNLLAEYEEGEHPLWKEAHRLHLVRNVPLREMLSILRIYPACGKDVWIVENSGVSSTLMDMMPEVPLVCTHGQLKLATQMVLDFLVQEGCTLHYSGDFDPEGIGMAERLLHRYPNNIRLWRMDKRDYMLTRPEVEISEARLKKLESIEHEQLAGVKDQMITDKKAGYQEAIIEDLAADLGK